MLLRLKDIILKKGGKRYHLKERRLKRVTIHQEFMRPHVRLHPAQGASLSLELMISNNYKMAIHSHKFKYLF